jgi:uncharacterized glyoxalase superfamily protein PhnB
MPITPMLLVADVEASSRWLRSVLPLSSAHGGPDFEMLADERGETILWLHALRADHEHPQLEGMKPGSLTGGSIFYLQVSDVDGVCEKARAAGACILEEPYQNPLARFYEFTFEDPNGYRFAVHNARLGEG